MFHSQLGCVRNNCHDAQKPRGDHRQSQFEVTFGRLYTTLAAASLKRTLENCHLNVKKLKNCQKRDSFFNYQKFTFFQNNCQWQLFWKKLKFLAIFLKKNVKFLAIFWHSNGNFSGGSCDKYVLCTVNAGKIINRNVSYYSLAVNLKKKLIIFCVLRSCG